MSNDACILTTKDFTILEVMFDRCLGRDDPMAPLLKRKLDAARVVFRDDVPAEVATLSSRVVFSVDGRDPDTRVISPDRMNAPVGLYLPVTTFRGLALLGLSEGQTFSLPGQDGVEETVSLERVLYQPEAARREKEALHTGVGMSGKPALRLVQGGFRARPDIAGAARGGFDDPDGPTAA